MPRSDNEQLKAELQHYAASIGIDELRVSGPRTHESFPKNHLRWLGRGYAGDMHYLERKPADRYDACSLLPECRSVIVTAHNYYVDKPSQSAGSCAKVSRYAWGDDYHEVIRERLGQLKAWLDTRLPGQRSKLTVDTSPIAEKAFAIQAGIGWAGRNSLVLSPRLGTYFFIGLLLSSAELPLDEALAADCGTCTACLRACPTDALSGPGILDATRCTSYLTTERKTAPEPGEELNGWLYGCDTCQEVCPFNADLEATSSARFQPRQGISEFQTRDVLGMDELSFEQRFEGTVIKRRRLDRMQSQARCLEHSQEKH